MFLSKNADSALKLGQARGAALAAVPAGARRPRIRAARHQARGGRRGRRGESPGRAHGQATAAASTCGSRRMRPMRWRSPSAMRIPADSSLRSMEMARDRIRARQTRDQDAAASDGGRGRRGLRHRSAHVHVLHAARRRAARCGCSRTWWCARTRTSSTASARRKSARCFATCSRCQASGPKIALAILSGVSVEGFATCVKLQDAAALTQDSRRRPQDGRAVVGRDARPARCTQRRGCRRRAGAERRRTQTEGEAWSALVALGYKPGRSHADAQALCRARRAPPKT